MDTIINKGKILYCDNNGRCISSKEANIFYENGSIKQTIPIPTNKLYRILTKIRLLERALRLEPRFAYMIDDQNLIFSFHGAMYRANIISKQVDIECIYRNEMNNPLKLCHTNCFGYDSYIFGEYWENTEQKPVGVFQRDSEGKWSCIFTFPQNTIKHIHQIVYDKYRNRFLIATGDDDKESGIWEADLSFKCIKPIISGKQNYRSCFVVPTIRGFYFATDSPNEKNGIFEVIEGNETDVRKVYDLPGPCIYGRVFEQEIVISTSVEPDYTLPKWRSRFTRKIGFGIDEPYCYIIKGNIENGFKILGKYKKDNHSMWLFQMGNIFIADGDSKNILVSGTALEKIDGISLEIHPE